MISFTLRSSLACRDCEIKTGWMLRRPFMWGFPRRQRPESDAASRRWHIRNRSRQTHHTQARNQAPSIRGFVILLGNQCGLYNNTLYSAGSSTRLLPHGYAGDAMRGSPSYPGPRDPIPVDRRLVHSAVEVQRRRRGRSRLAAGVRPHERRVWRRLPHLGCCRIV
jgi:hypothetical protein